MNMTSASVRATDLVLFLLLQVVQQFCLPLKSLQLGGKAAQGAQVLAG